MARVTTATCFRTSISESSVTDEVVARMSYSQTVGRAQYGDLFASTTRRCAEPPDSARWPDRWRTRGIRRCCRSSRRTLTSRWSGTTAKTATFQSAGSTRRCRTSSARVCSPSLCSACWTRRRAWRARARAMPSAYIDSLGVDRSEAHLFTMVALIDELGSTEAAQAEFEAHLVNGVLPQTYVDAILGCARRSRRRQRP